VCEADHHGSPRVAEDLEEAAGEVPGDLAAEQGQELAGLALEGGGGGAGAAGGHKGAVVGRLRELFVVCWEGGCS